jgi:hypothetical protein
LLLLFSPPRWRFRFQLRLASASAATSTGLIVSTSAIDMNKLKKAVSDFNRHPPVWAYILFGLAIIILVQIIRFS